ncbi:granulocyte colony-stimulating factor isoform X2 [Lathamus discolor]|uniref:granulocyte colony-stimulating factor isoform X2 n=1 Tax=Lathamus discolor TaxID=678569 RepID=UPI0032B8680B
MCAATRVLALLLLWAPWQALLGAPLAELSGDQRFLIFLSNNLEFTRKIKGDVAALQHAVVSPGHRAGGAAVAVSPSHPYCPPLLTQGTRSGCGHARGCCSLGDRPRAQTRGAAPSPPYWVPGLPHRTPQGWELGVTGSSSHPDHVPPRPQCDTFQLCKEEELLLLRQDLSIAQAPMERCHGRSFQAEACFSQIREGLRTYQSSLDAVLELLPGHAALVESLQLDAANLSSNIQHQMEDLGLASVTYPTEARGPLPVFSSHFHHQVGSFFILADFQRFLEAAYRALRHLAHL